MTVETIRAGQKNVTIMFLAEFMRDHPSYAKYVETLVNPSKIGFRNDVAKPGTRYPDATIGTHAVALKKTEKTNELKSIFADINTGTRKLFVFEYVLEWAVTTMRSAIQIGSGDFPLGHTLQSLMDYPKYDTHTYIVNSCRPCCH